MRRHFFRTRVMVAILAGLVTGAAWTGTAVAFDPPNAGLNQAIWVLNGPLERHQAMNPFGRPVEVLRLSRNPHLHGGHFYLYDSDRGVIPSAFFSVDAPTTVTDWRHVQFLPDNRRRWIEVRYGDSQVPERGQVVASVTITAVG